MTVLFADERAVPPDDPESNFRLVREALLEPLGDRAPRAARMAADASDLEAAALAYEPEVDPPLDLRRAGGGRGRPHRLAVSGLAVCSPSSMRRVAAVTDSPKPPARRLTLTPRALAEARALLVLASGDSKARAVTAALALDADPLQVPAALVAAGQWIVDREAAGH